MTPWTCCRAVRAVAGAVVAGAMAVGALAGLFVLVWGWAWAERAGYDRAPLEIDG